MKKQFIIISAAMLLVSCSASNTRLSMYPKMYEEKPTTIVIMPPINQTNTVEAKEYFYTTMYIPLCEKGYYVFSPYLTMEMLQSESAYDSELFLEADLTTFRDALGADAAMFTIIKSWKKNAFVGSITVGIEYVLRSTITGETLFQREGLISVSTQVNSGSGTLIGLAIDRIATAINTAATEKVVAGRVCNAYVLTDLPVGKYDANYGLDGNVKVGDSYIKGTAN